MASRIRMAALLALGAATVICAQTPPPFPQLRIYLCDEPVQNPQSRLQPILLGIESEARLYYKLTLDGRIVAAGQLQKGENRIPLTVDLLDTAEQRLVYNLESLLERRRQRRRLEISLLAGESPAAASSGESRTVQIPSLLSLFVGDRLLYQEKKAHRAFLSPEKLAALPGTPPQPTSVERPYPDLKSSAVSLTGVAAAALALLKQKKTERRERDLRAELRKRQVLAWTLIRSDAEGREREMRVQVLLRVSPATVDDLDGGGP